MCITKSRLNNLSCSSSSSSSSAVCKYTEEGLWVCLSGSSAGEYTRVTSVEHASHLLREKKVLFCINVLVMLTHTQELVFFLVYNLIIASNCTVHNASRIYSAPSLNSQSQTHKLMNNSPGVCIAIIIVLYCECMHYVPILQVRPELQHVIGQLAFGVELQSLQPHPNPMNTKWLSDFITEKVAIRIGYL